jgi:rhodanese-related sulfurtransferase
MAGLFRLAPWKFVLLDGGGAALWAGAFVGTGWLFRLQLEDIARYLERMGVWFGLAALVALAAYIAFKYVQRQRIYHALRIARILPDDLKNRLDAGEIITIIDVRNAVERSEGAIPGAIPLQISQLDSLDRAQLDNEIVLYCSCPNEVTAARAAMHLKHAGAMRVRPLQGGFELWRDMGFPIEMPAPLDNAKAALASEA